MDVDSHQLFTLSRYQDVASLRNLLGTFCAMGELSGALLDAEGEVLTDPIWANPLVDEERRSSLKTMMRDCGREAITQPGKVVRHQTDTEDAYASAMVMEGRTIGAVSVAGQVPAEKIETLLRPLCETFSLLCHQEHQLSHRVQELSAVHEVAGLLVGRSDLQEILNLVTQRVVEVMGVRACSIRLLDKATGQLTIRAVCNLSEAYLRKGPVVLEENPIDALAFQGKTVYIEDAPTDPRTRYPAQAKAEGIVSGLIVGMIYRGRAVGIIRAYTGVKHRFSGFEALLLRAIAAQTAAAIVNARLYEDKVKTDQYKRQLRYAGQVQRRMIPKHPPEHSRISFGCVYEPSLAVGGDFYDFIELPRGHVGVAIADVVGKGVPASVMMASVRSALRVYAHTVYDIDEIISHVNRHLCRDTLVSEFATLFYGVLSPEGRTLTYCNAGHEPPLLLRDGAITPLAEGGMVIGVLEDTQYEKKVLTLQAGDVLLFVTDGVTEALNFGEEAFGRERLEKSLRKFAPLEGAKIAENVLWDVRRFVGLADQTDDITMVSMKVG